MTSVRMASKIAAVPHQWKMRKKSSGGDPDPEDPHDFGPPGSGTVKQRYGSGSFPFLIKVLSGLKKYFQYNTEHKISIFIFKAGD
jgi:hypothetical protein